MKEIKSSVLTVFDKEGKPIPIPFVQDAPTDLTSFGSKIFLSKQGQKFGNGVATLLLYQTYFPQSLNTARYSWSISGSALNQDKYVLGLILYGAWKKVNGVWKESFTNLPKVSSLDKQFVEIYWDGNLVDLGFAYADESTSLIDLIFDMTGKVPIKINPFVSKSIGIEEKANLDIEFVFDFTNSVATAGDVEENITPLLGDIGEKGDVWYNVQTQDANITVSEAIKNE